MRLSRPMRKASAWIGALAISSLAAIPFGCTDSALEGARNLAGGRPVREVSNGGAGGPVDSIVIGSFNMERFGKSKSGKPEVMAQFAAIAAQFDVVALQEVQLATIGEEPIQRLAAMADEISRQSGYVSQYQYLISGKIARPSDANYYEQYAFLYDASVLEVDRSTVYQVSDPSDRMHREPYVARFRCRRNDGRPGFSFSLVNVHTDPDEVDEELLALGDVFFAVANDGSGEDDIILLGDFNAAGRDLVGLGGRRDVVAAILGAETTNVRRDAQYDNFVYSSLATSEYGGAAGVLEFDEEARLSREQALDVSDHLPVWATFSTLETPPALASAASGAGR